MFFVFKHYLYNIGDQNILTYDKIINELIKLVERHEINEEQANKLIARLKVYCLDISDLSPRINKLIS